tara:strand:+ start:182 stop:394 length:213 start_codon:yes stop_codon:yes gene_type:complete
MKKNFNKALYELVIGYKEHDYKMRIQRNEVSELDKWLKAKANINFLEGSVSWDIVDKNNNPVKPLSYELL